MVITCARCKGHWDGHRDGQRLDGGKCRYEGCRCRGFVYELRRTRMWRPIRKRLCWMLGHVDYYTDMDVRCRWCWLDLWSDLSEEVDRVPEPEPEFYEKTGHEKLAGPKGPLP